MGLLGSVARLGAQSLLAKKMAGRPGPSSGLGRIAGFALPFLLRRSPYALVGGLAWHYLIEPRLRNRRA